MKKFRTVFLKPFKFDKSDPGRQNDLLRGIIILRELKRFNYEPDKISDAVKGARKDLPQYSKLAKKYKKITIDNIEDIAKNEKVNIKIYYRDNAREDFKLQLQTKNTGDEQLNVSPKFFNEANDYSLANMQMLLNPQYSPSIYRALSNKLTYTSSWTCAMR